MPSSGYKENAMKENEQPQKDRLKITKSKSYSIMLSKKNISENSHCGSVGYEAD